MYGFVLVLHIIVCSLLILIVLLQTGKGASIAGLFGGGSGSEALFGGPSGPTLLKKVTAILAITFMLTSLLLTIFVSREPRRSVIEKIPMQQGQ